VASYGVGGHFYLHHDPMFIYKEPGFLAKSVESRGSEQYVTGNFLLFTSCMLGWVDFFTFFIFWHFQLNIRNIGIKICLALEPFIVGDDYLGY
jgi:hypothetical protein